ncbi:MAG: glutamate racemase [Clostridium sp.]|nr:glutamate racemase [Clostridium sp.]
MITIQNPEFPAGSCGPLGVFDSGFGGLTILREIRRALPAIDCLYLGDNARAPYGVRSFDVVYEFTLEAVRYLFSRGCPLVILACNTASAKALRSIQQNDLPMIAPDRRVLGVIRPTVELLGSISRTGHIGVLGTDGTVSSRSYDLEIAKLHPGFTVASQACPLWVPLIENGEIDTPATDYFVSRYTSDLMARDPLIDTVILGCTHYPLLLEKIRRALPPEVTIVTQGEIVAASLSDYLRRHPEIDRRLTRGGQCRYLTTENAGRFGHFAEFFMKSPVEANHVDL